MTPKELQKQLVALKQELAGVGHIGCFIKTYAPDEPPVYVTIDDVHSVQIARFNAETLEEVVPLLRQHHASWQDSRRDRCLTGIALAIIRITDEAGACTEAALRLDGFTAGEIAEFGEEAAAKANTMAGRGPFSIERSANSNAEAA